MRHEIHATIRVNYGSKLRLPWLEAMPAVARGYACCGLRLYLLWLEAVLAEHNKRSLAVHYGS